MKNKIARNAAALHSASVPTDRPALWVFFSYATFAAGVIGWCIYSTAGGMMTLALTFIPSITFILPRLFYRNMMNPFKNDLLKPASVGGRKAARVAAPATEQNRNKLFCENAN